MFQTPGVQSLLQQVQTNPQLFENMMQSPYMQELMNQLLGSPDTMNSVSLYSLLFILSSIHSPSFAFLNVRTVLFDLRSWNRFLRDPIFGLHELILIPYRHVFGQVMVAVK